MDWRCVTMAVDKYRMVMAKHGITNEYYEEKKIYGNLEDDMAKINKVFQIFNKEFFNDVLDRPVIIISPDVKVLYKVERPGEWKKEKNNKTDDELMKIVLSEKLFGYSTKEFYLRLLDVMIYQYDLEQEAIYEYLEQSRTRLVGNNGNYLSKGYFNLCERLGIKVQEIRKADTNKKEKIITPKDKFNQVYENNNIEEIGKLVYSYKQPQKKEDKIQKQSMRAFKCPNCGMIIRITKSGDVDIRCYNINDKGIECNGTRFVIDDKKKKINS